jgi:hypothetical protein
MTRRGPSIVVLDELPYLMDPGGAFESVLQRSSPAAEFPDQA